MRKPTEEEKQKLAYWIWENKVPLTNTKFYVEDGEEDYFLAESWLRHCSLPVAKRQLTDQINFLLKFCKNIKK